MVANYAVGMVAVYIEGMAIILPVTVYSVNRVSVGDVWLSFKTILTNSGNGNSLRISL